MDNPTFSCVSATENGGDGFDFVNTNNALLCNGLAHANSGAADVFIDATCDGTSIYDGCIEFSDIINNGTNTSIFLEKEAFNGTFTAIAAIPIKTCGTDNIFVGFNAGNCTLTGIQNSSVGVNTLTNLTTGSCNTATGYNALFNNTTGNDNTADGCNALFS